MRLLIDECIGERLRLMFPGHGRQTARFANLAGLKNRRLLEAAEATLVFYEAPHRVLEALDAIEQTLGPRPVVVARELTKIHEEFLRGTAAEIRAQLALRDGVRGEITVLIGKAVSPPPDETPLPEAVEALIRAGTPRMDAIKEVARRRGLSKREVYDRLLAARE